MKMSPAVAFAFLSGTEARIERNVVAAEAVTVSEARRYAVKQSSGGNTLTALAQAGHPYARRNPNGSYDPSVINVQTGRFRAAWAAHGPALTGSRVISRVTNDSPEAAYMVGTKTMVARPIRQAVIDAVTPKRLVRLRRAVRAAITP